jgi:CRP-like cAMP-binding protein
MRSQLLTPLQLVIRASAGREPQEYKKGQPVFSQGEAANAVFYIQSGRAKATVISQQGKEAMVALLEAGQFCGESCLNGERQRTSSVTALADSQIISLPKKVMIAALQKEPEFSKVFMEHLLRRNSRIEEDVIDQLFNSSEKRLARLLLLLANYGKDGNPPIAPVVLNQEMLADMIGTTRSRVSFFMNKFRRLGLIDYNGKIDVHQSLLNAVLYDKPEICESGG